MKLFRNKQTGEMYLCIYKGENSIQMLSLHDSSFLTALGEGMDNYEEVNTAPKKPDPVEMTYEFRKTEEIMLKEIQDNLNGDEPLKNTFSIGDILHVPVQGYENPVPFEIVHVNEETRSLYFMSRDILEQMSMTKVDEWLEEFKSKLPPELVDCLKPIEHINENGIYRRLLSLPSIKNMGIGENGCKGADDIPFDKFNDEASRCKNFNKKTIWYCTDTPVASNSMFLWNIGSNGCAYIGKSASSNGVCPIFKLSKDK